MGEVGIIVIGVLIALGAEQVVEAVHDRRVADETRKAVTEEIDTNLANVQLRATIEPCMARRLAELHAMVEQWGRLVGRISVLKSHFLRQDINPGDGLDRNVAQFAVARHPAPVEEDERPRTSRAARYAYERSDCIQ